MSTSPANSEEAPKEERSQAGDLDGAPLIDSHCHLQSLESDERELAMDQARERGITGFLVPALHLDEAEDLLDFCHRHPDVWCALGTHPHEASEWREGDSERLRALLSDPKAVAVGECGLDFFYDHAPREQQIEVMREQWSLAIELNLPVVVHNRDSNQAMLEQLLLPEFEELQADFHSFAGGIEMGRELIELDCYLGFTGMITFKRADNVREVIPEVPHDRMLVETDTPYLAPVPFRGKANQPAYVVEIATRLAQERGESLAELAQRTSENFFDLFAKANEDG